MSTRVPAPRTSEGVVVEHVTKSFGESRVLTDLSLRLAPGSFTAVLGRSGCGKSTLLRLLAGLDGDYVGTVRAGGDVAVAFQEPRLWPWARVESNVAVGLQGKDVKDRARAALAEVGLADKARSWPLTLSGGQAQRASLARALVREPSVLLLDEPFGALDALTRLSMHHLVLDLWRRHAPTVLLVTHDVDEALALADRVLVLDRGQVSFDAEVPEERAVRAESLGIAALRRRLLEALHVRPAKER
ncbi:ABC transporter ATP-binding protein [Motilibacter deserti]|uniref:ABC transporter ATP-binding protein n=1 Tax=Motilibacter deserti TaxID=2714956 RepID=A0ABX0H3G3_9ACTN|nr:ABC transporter ATP-binding protein [Motilibacter deserti]NHC16277.1 ABC transporter ATP-binding protein [Motilibacter deserti]